MKRQHRMVWQQTNLFQPADRDDQPPAEEISRAAIAAVAQLLLDYLRDQAAGHSREGGNHELQDHS